MKKFLILVLFCVYSVAAFSEELIEVKMLDNKVSIKAPVTFRPMPADMLAQKYPSSRRPTEALSDKTGEVSLAFNHTHNAMKIHEVREAHLTISKMFHNMYPSATWLRDEVIEQHGQTVMVLELITPAVDTKIHNILYGTSVDGRFLLVAFNTTVEKSEHWLPIGRKIMASMQVMP